MIRGLVFCAGFVLGPIRILWVVPRVGTRMAELMEAPIMLVVTILTARWVVQRHAVPWTVPARILGVVRGAAERRRRWVFGS